MSDHYAPHYHESYAIIIGINSYERAAPLSYAVNDAEAVAGLLQQQFHFKNEHIHLLLNDEATKKNIMSRFLTFATESISPDDKLFFFYAGHGTTKTGRRGEVGFLVPFDGKEDDLTSLIRWDDLVRNAEFIEAKHIFFVMDACYGGLAITRNLRTRNARFLQNMMQRYSRQVLTAGKADEAVADYGGPIANHSVFTGHLIQGLMGNAATHSGVITASGLMNYVYHQVANDAYSEQTPHYGFLEGDGDFVFDLGAPTRELAQDFDDESLFVPTRPGAASASGSDGFMNTKGPIPETSLTTPHSDDVHKVQPCPRPSPANRAFIPVITVFLAVCLAAAGVSWFFLAEKAEGVRVGSTNIMPDLVTPFARTGDGFHILILPLAQLEQNSDQQAHFEETLKRRLLDMSEKQDLGLHIKLFQKQASPGTAEQAREIGRKYRADLVIWGDLFERGNAGSRTKLRWVVINDDLENVKKTGATPMRSFRSVSEIMQGSLRAEVDFIVFWTLGLRSYFRNDMAKAKTWFEKIEIDTMDDRQSPVEQKDRANYYLFLANTCHYQNQFQLALGYYNRAIQLDPREAKAFYNRGVNHAKQGFHTAAFEDYNKTIELDSEFIEAYHNRGNIYRDAGQYQLALKDYGQAIKLDPGLAKSYISRGVTYERLDQSESALADYDRAIKLEPQDPMAYLYRGRLHGWQSRPEAGLADLNRAIELDQHFAAAYYYRGRIHMGRDHFQLAGGDFKKAIQLNPRHARAYRYLGSVSLALNEPASALEQFNRAVELKPGNALSFLERGKAFDALQRHASAAEDYREALRLFSERVDGGSYYNMAHTHLRLHDPAAAMASLEKAFQLKPKLVAWAQTDSDLDCLRSRPGFQALLDQYTALAKAEPARN